MTEPTRLGEMIKVKRSMKARRTGHCALCGGPTTLGQLIGKTDEHGWVHIKCVVRDIVGPRSSDWML
jgi:hypothetical protein